MKKKITILALLLLLVGVAFAIPDPYKMLKGEQMIDREIGGRYVQEA